MLMVHCGLWPIPTSVADTDVGEAIRTCSIQISVTDVFLRLAPMARLIQATSTLRMVSKRLRVCVCVFEVPSFRDENFPQIRDFPCFLWPPGSFLRTV